MHTHLNLSAAFHWFLYSGEASIQPCARLFRFVCVWREGWSKSMCRYLCVQVCLSSRVYGCVCVHLFYASVSCRFVVLCVCVCLYFNRCKFFRLQHVFVCLIVGHLNVHLQVSQLIQAATLRRSWMFTEHRTQNTEHRTHARTQTAVP